MQFFSGLLSNKILIAAFFGWLTAQLLKTIIYVLVNKNFDPERLVGDGGMPSSHSAVVCSLAACIGKEYGFNSGIFAISVVMAFVVMYDAAGVRRAAGKQATILNKILETPGMTTLQVQEKLVEVLGHTPIQVFVGAILGVIVGGLL